jgi:hemoglobin
VTVAVADETKAVPPTVSEQVLSLEAMCAENAEAMATRQTEKSLYERLGGEEKIHAIVAEVVRLHGVNEPIKHLLDGIDQKHLIDMVTEFLVVGSGGPGEYTGRSMADSHDYMELTNADFLAAGSDVMQAMKNKECGEAEMQEVICALVSLRDQVVIESEKVVK